jgi:hypothetical protein
MLTGEIVSGSAEMEVRPSVSIDNFKAVGKNQTVMLGKIKNRL